MLPAAELSHRAIDGCLQVCAHYGLSLEATRQALESAKVHPAQAARCYEAIITSLQEAPNARTKDN
jgi:hypothetical protein